MPQRIKLNLACLFVLGLSAILAIYLGADYTNYKWLLICFAIILITVNVFQSFFLRVGKDILLGFCTFIFMLLVVDGVLRVTMKDRLYYREQERFENRMPEYPSLLLRYDKNVDYAGEVFGDLAAISGQLEFKTPRVVHFKTDANGFRNTPGQESRKNSVLITGDSFGVGSGTEQDSTWAGRLLKKQEVYNLSFPGNPLQELANLALEYDRIDHTENPTVVWLLFTGNDQPNSILPQHHGYVDLIAQNKLQDGEAGWISNIFARAVNYFRRSPVRLLISRMSAGGKKPTILLKDFDGGKKMFFYEEYVKASQATNEEIAAQPGYETFKKVFSTAKKLADEKKFKLKVVLAPTKYEVYPWVYEGDSLKREVPPPSGFSRLLTSMLGELGIDFFDAKPFLYNAAAEAYTRDKSLWWLDDTHLNTEGNRVLSAFIQDSVLRH